MRRIGFAVVLAVGFLASALASEAQQSGKTPRIGMLFLGWQSIQGDRAESVRDELRKLGYVEGQTIAFETRFANGRLDRVRVLATELVNARVDVILTAGTAVIQEIRPVAGSIPIVASMVDPIRAGFAQSFAHPGGNITGVAFDMADLTAKRLQLLKEVLPGMSRVAFLYYSGKVNSPTVSADHLQAAESAARAMGLSVSMSGVEREGDFQNAFASAKRSRAQAVLQLGSTSFVVHRHALVDSATKTRLPVACEEREFVLIGCLLAYGPSYRDNTRRAAAYVDKILKGARAGDLPIEQPTKFELVINMKTAKTLGVTIPPSVLGRGDQIIE